ncbi:hypoxanthine-guanine phosphoribosyltransferase [Spiroplasma gladiatoris]|uniref:Hypoxanthine-guanine phosphoribosyltransferase n=1 Tax=Spiroplasma gladiatoris TaxID=2143 RepID=A0A4P7AIA5_9MOLU|nr:phosphoribosyltransferase family protein [Spiroplasma gladiatoris]QBQ08204.1 hypoxanthine-guanine phosphoribosyltransferase [Spiroplasma gladiatoris]
MEQNNNLVTLITEEEIKASIRKAAVELAKVYEGEQLTIVAELSSAFVFVADLIRELPIDVTIQFIIKNQATDARSIIDLGMQSSLKDRHVLLVTDVFYKGNTLQRVYDLVQEEKPADVKVLALIDKKFKNRNVSIPVTSLFSVDEVYIVGYGLTYNESYRGLKGIYNLIIEG